MTLPRPPTAWGSTTGNYSVCGEGGGGREGGREGGGEGERKGGREGKGEREGGGRKGKGDGVRRSIVHHVLCSRYILSGENF